MVDLISLICFVIIFTKLQFMGISVSINSTEIVRSKNRIEVLRWYCRFLLFVCYPISFDVYVFVN